MSSEVVENTERELAPSRFAAWGFWLPFIAISVANLLPIWGVRWLPLVDFGGHVELIDIIIHQHDKATVYPDLYVVDLTIAPNTLSLWIAQLLGFLGALNLAKLLLSVYVVGVPLTLVGLCRVFDRDPRLAWLSFPLLWNYMLFMGFLNYLLAMPLVLGSVALAQHHVRNPRWLTAAALVVVYATSFYSHMLGCLVAVGMGVYTLAIGSKPKELGRALIPLVAMLIAYPWLNRMFTGSDTRVVDYATRYMPMERMLQELFMPISAMESNFDDITSVLLLVCFLPLLIFGKIRLGKLEWMAVLTFGVYLFLPENAFQVNVISQRVIGFFWWLLLLWPRTIPKWLARFVFPAAATVSALYGVWMYGQFQRFSDEQLGALPAAIGKLPSNSTLSYFDSTCIDWTNNPIIKPCVGFHLPRLIHTVKNHGITNMSFATQPTTAVQYAPGKALPDWRTDFWAEPYRTQFDFHLIRMPGEPTAALNHPGLKLRAHAGAFWLFERVN